MANDVENQNQPAAKTVLLAEDDVSMRRFLEVILRRGGYRVLSAEDGLAAIQIAAENRFDVVVLDAIMPNLTGHEIARILRNHPIWRHIPIIMLSGLEPEPNHEADAQLLKDSRLQENLLQKLKELLVS